MTQAKKDGVKEYKSITGLQSWCCTKGVNGYHKWYFFRGKCKNGKHIAPADLKFKDLDTLVTINQFELMTLTYKTVEKKTVREVEKHQTEKNKLLLQRGIRSFITNYVQWKSLT